MQLALSSEGLRGQTVSPLGLCPSVLNSPRAHRFNLHRAGKSMPGPHGGPFTSKEHSLGSTATLTWVTLLVSGIVSPEMDCVDGHKPENTAPLLLQADLGLLVSGRKIAKPLSCQYLVLCE